MTNRLSGKTACVVERTRRTVNLDLKRPSSPPPSLWRWRSPGCAGLGLPYGVRWSPLDLMSTGGCSLFAMDWPGGALGEVPGEGIAFLTFKPSQCLILACCLLVFRVPRPGLWIFIFLLRNRTPVSASDLASWPSQLWVSLVVWIPRVSWVYLSACLFSAQLLPLLPRFHLSGLSCCSGLRPCALSRLVPLLDFLSAWPLSYLFDLFFSVSLLIFSWFQGLPWFLEVSSLSVHSLRPVFYIKDARCEGFPGLISR